jgi:hypothetical protein
MSLHPLPVFLPSPVNPAGHVQTTLFAAADGSLQVAPATHGVVAHSSVLSTHWPFCSRTGVPPDVAGQVQSRPVGAPKQVTPLEHVAHPVAMAPHASFPPTQAPEALHFPVLSHASRPSLQVPFTFFGCGWQAPETHTPVVQSPSLAEQFMSAPLHAPLVHASAVVQGSPSLQLATLGTYWHPFVVLQESVVHGFLSSQTVGALVQPVLLSHVSVVQALPSSGQTTAALTAHAPLKHEFVVQRSPSSHGDLSSCLPY